MTTPLKFLRGAIRPGAVPRSDAMHVRRFRKAAEVLGWICVAMSAAGAADAIADHLRPVAHDHPWTGIPHQPLPAVCALLFTALAVLAARHAGRLARGLQAGLGAAIIGMGLFAVEAGSATFWTLDRLTGWIVLLLGFAVLSGASRVALIGYARQFAVFAVFFLCGLVAVGNLYEVSDAEHFLTGYLKTPWSTAATGLVAAHALLFQHPNFGVMRLLSGTGFGCQIMRRMLPSIVLLLVLLGWVLALGEHRGWFPPSFGEGLYAVLAVSGFSGILLFTAASLNRIDGERQEREKETLRSQEQLQAILDHTPAIICLKDLEGRYQLVNERFCRTAGKSREECLGKRGEDLLTLQAGRIVREKHEQAIATRRPVEYIERFLCADGSMRAHLCACVPLLDDEGAPYAVCGVYTDIDDIKKQEDEIRELNASLREKTRRQKAANSELEAFSYSVSHDLRAPLRHIAGFAQLLSQRNREKLDPKSAHYIEVIQTSVKRMGDLIDDLLSFSRASKVALAPKNVDTNALVAEVRAELDARHEGPEVAWEIGPLPETHGDPAMLRLVWVNLLSNAVKYSSKNPAPRVTVEFGPVGDEPRVFSVKDNGAGFDMRYADKLFGVFQRLHSAQDYDGTGIGLAMVRRILERHGGSIRAEAAPGEGARFYFVLPEPRRSDGERDVPEKDRT